MPKKLCKRRKKIQENIRKRISEKKRRKNQVIEAAETKIVSSGKGGLSDSDFNSLSLGYDPSAPSSGDFKMYDDDEDLFGDKWNQ